MVIALRSQKSLECSLSLTKSEQSRRESRHLEEAQQMRSPRGRRVDRIGGSLKEDYRVMKSSVTSLSR